MVFYVESVDIVDNVVIEIEFFLKYKEFFDEDIEEFCVFWVVLESIIEFVEGILLERNKVEYVFMMSLLIGLDLEWMVDFCKEVFEKLNYVLFSCYVLEIFIRVLL